MHIIIGLVIAFVIIAIFARSNMATRNCRWRAAREKDRDGQHYYYCAACGAEFFSSSQDVPKVCKAGQSGL